MPVALLSKNSPITPLDERTHQTEVLVNSLPCPHKPSDFRRPVHTVTTDTLLTPRSTVLLEKLTGSQVAVYFTLNVP